MRVLSRVQWDEYVQIGRDREDSKGAEIRREIRPISRVGCWGKKWRCVSMRVKRKDRCAERKEYWVKNMSIMSSLDNSSLWLWMPQVVKLKRSGMATHSNQQLSSGRNCWSGTGVLGCGTGAWKHEGAHSWDHGVHGQGGTWWTSWPSCWSFCTALSVVQPFCEAPV